MSSFGKPIRRGKPRGPQSVGAARCGLVTLIAEASLLIACSTRASMEADGSSDASQSPVVDRGQDVTQLPVIDGGPDAQQQLLNTECIDLALPPAVPMDTTCQTNGKHTVDSQQPPGVGYEDTEPPDPIPDKVAYLTFDDGPSEWTMDFLRILRDKKVQATFFICAKNYPKGKAGLDKTYVDDNGATIAFRDVLRHVVEEGHAIGNHTTDHSDLAELTLADAQHNLEENEYLINLALSQAGAEPRPLTLIRPPFGSPWFIGQVVHPVPAPIQRSIGRILQNFGVNVLWNVSSTDGQDWALQESFTRIPANDPVRGANAPAYEDKISRIKMSVLNNPLVAMGKGIIVLMHDTHNATRDALPDIIDGLRTRGYSFATIEDYVRWRWKRPSIEVTPGPYLYSSCVPEMDQGCATFSANPGSPRPEVCGRFWAAYEAARSTHKLGPPLAPSTYNTVTGVFAQRFEQGVLELNFTQAPPCNVQLTYGQPQP